MIYIGATEEEGVTKLFLSDRHPDTDPDGFESNHVMVECSRRAKMNPECVPGDLTILSNILRAGGCPNVTQV